MPTGWGIPWAIPWAIGPSTLDVTVAHTYVGSWGTFPIIRITGPVTSPVLSNVTTDEKLDFTGITIAAGDYYDIDLRYGYKTVEDAAGTNKIADLSNDSDLAEWHIASTPEAAGGINELHLTGTAATASTKVELSYFTRYIGL